MKITKRANYNVEISNSFNTELQLKDIESEIKSKLIDLLTQLKGFKFVTTLFLVFKKIRQSMTLFIHTQKQKQLSMEATLLVCLNQSYMNLNLH